jgi:ribonucleoside-diphosphate reductase alpha chain
MFFLLYLHSLTFSLKQTCNFPEDATIQDVINAYIEAWRLRCKGLTVYRSNSRQYQVLESLEEAERKRKKKTTDAVPMDGVSQGHHHHQLAVSADSTNKLVEQRRYRPAAGMAKPTCCPVCESSDNVLHTEGCVKCLCGWSAC